MSTERKRSLSIAGHRTSVSLEDPFWEGLKRIAARDGKTLATLIAEIDSRRGDNNLSSALRLHERRQEGGHSLSRSQRVKLARLAREHAAERLIPRDLAAELDLSPDYFARLFHKSFGLSPRAWLVDQRIRHAAAALVNSTRSVSQIAADFGYDDVFLFSRQFKQVLGAGPRAYRNANGAS